MCEVNDERIMTKVYLCKRPFVLRRTLKCLPAVDTAVCNDAKNDVCLLPLPGLFKSKLKRSRRPLHGHGD